MCEEICKDDNDEKVNEFMQEFHEHGLGCGDEIANIAKKLHPDALIVIPLYRSCIVIEQSEKEKKEGACTLHSYADPHWMGGEIDVENLKSEQFHREFCIQGDRQGPIIVNKNCKEEDSQEEEEEEEDEDRPFIENDEN